MIPAAAPDAAGAGVPPLVYGTAWKEERTEALVGAALEAGFRGIDTANQRKHYHEAAVGAALRGAFDSGLARADVFVQTKYTYVPAQDARLPYDAAAPIGAQVAQSARSSLEHLGVERLDAYLLHGPWGHPGLAPQDLEAWAAMEDLHRAGLVRLLGVSNVTAGQLAGLHASAAVKPQVVQNRTFTRPHADAEVRAFCRREGIAYQGFSLLTAIPWVAREPTVAAVAARAGATVPQVVFRACLAAGIVVLTGTTSRTHMAEDLAASALELPAADLDAVRRALGLS